ncbi:hypothetical protein OIU92_00030 [Escherichia coli]|nr:hypothetical protein [Escherichia coli]
MWAQAFNAAAEEIREEVITDEDKDILTFCVVCFASGFAKVKALSSNPGNIRGMQGNVSPSTRRRFHEQLDEVLKAVTPLDHVGR